MPPDTNSNEAELSVPNFALDEEIYRWMMEQCPTPGEVQPPGYAIPYDEAVGMLSIYLKENWQHFSDRLFPGAYEGAEITAEEYDFLGWDTAWKLTLLAKDDTGYAWADTLYLDSSSGEIEVGASGPR